MRRMFRSRKAVSPVIATIIIVAIAISIAIAVAYWMVGITGAFTRFEKLEVVSGYASYIESATNYEVYLTVKNTGTTDATVNMVFINGKPSDDWGASVEAVEYFDTTSDQYVSLPETGVSIKAGQQQKFRVKLKAGTDPDEFSAGQSVEITIHTASGKDYPKNVVLQ